MNDVTCAVCAAWITPFGQTDGVFCSRKDCPGLASGLVLSSLDVTNTGDPQPLVLSMTGQKIAAVRGAEVPTTPPPVSAKKVKRKPLPGRDRPGLFN